jgi:ABC-type oligopeptide transport system substrate-binding subunit
MSRSRINHKSRRQLRAACAGLVLIAAGVSLSACNQATETSTGGYEAGKPAEPVSKVEPIKGTEVQLVKFSALGAKKVGLQTALVRRDGEQKVIPYAALLYDSEGKAFVYTSPKPLTFVRKEVKAEREDGDRVMLAEGPPAGTRVVTTGAVEVYGTEFGVEEE